MLRKYYRYLPKTSNKIILLITMVMLIFALLFKGVIDELICTSLFRNYSFLTLADSLAYCTHFCVICGSAIMLVSCIWNDALMMIPPISGLPSLKIVYLLLKLWHKGIRSVKTRCGGCLLMMVSSSRSWKWKQRPFSPCNALLRYPLSFSH